MLPAASGSRWMPRKMAGSAMMTIDPSSVAMNIGSEVAATASQIGAVRRRPRVLATTGVASGATGAAGAAGAAEEVAGAVVVIASSYEGIE